MLEQNAKRVFFVFQLTASNVEFSAAMPNTWPPPRPLVASRKMRPWMWTTALRCGPTPCARGGRRAAAGATWSTTRPSSALRSYSLSTTAPATAPPPPPRCLARRAPPFRRCATTRTVPSSRGPPPNRRNTPTVDYSETLTYGRSETNFRPARWRGRGL